MSLPFVTIAIPFYNAEKYLAQAIQSVFAQTYPNWELILMDDGSTDNSLHIASSVEDARVRVFSDGLNKKLATRLNEITQHAQYNYLVRMDADDLIAPERIETQMNILLAKPSLDLVTTGVISLSNNLEFVGQRGQDFESITLNEILSKTKGITHAALVAKKAWHLRNPYNPKLKVAQDFTLWVEAAAKGDLNIQSIADPLYYYREEGNVKSKKMLLAYSYERKLIVQYAHGIFKMKLWLKALVKSGVVVLLSTINKMDILLKKRGLDTDSNAAKSKLAKDIAYINTTNVKGLNQPLSYET